ncbi:hypothetical protein NHQ30_005485 [Ciborinia camelliae]|nr:hypothetical protein NHQ30_005485 [Ciborinia camelliae]
MKSFACFSVILLAQFALSENLPFCPPAQVKYCVLDDCLQALSNKTTSAPQFCGRYLKDDSIDLPDYVPAAASASRNSSACSCLIQAQPTPKSTPFTPSLYILGSAGSSKSTTEVSSSETSVVPALSSAVFPTLPVSTPVGSESLKDYITSTVYALSTYTTHESGQLMTKTLSVVDSTTVYLVTQEVTQTPSPKSTAPMEYTTSTVYTISAYTNSGGDVITKTIVDYTTICPVTEKSTPTSQVLGESASEYTTKYETSTVYKVSTYTTLGQTITRTVVDYTTVCPITKTFTPTPTPKSIVEYTTSTVYSVSTSTYTASGKIFTVTDTVVDYTTVCPVTKSFFSTESVSASSAYSSASSTKTKPRHSRTKCTKSSHSTQSYPFGNFTSSFQATASGSAFSTSLSGTAYPSSVSYPMSNTTLSQTASGTGYLMINSTTTKIPQGTAYPSSHLVANSTSLQLPSETGSPELPTAYPMPNSTASYVPPGTVSSIPKNSTTSYILPTGTSSLEINISTSELPEYTEISITSAPSTVSSSAIPSVAEFCSTDAAALLFEAVGTPVTSYCSSLLSIQPTFVDGGYKFVTQTAYATTTTTIAAASVTVFKRSTELDLFAFTSTYHLVQQSSACSCLSIQPAEISVTTTITVPATSTIVISTTPCTAAPTQVVVNGDFETETSGSYQTPWTLSTLSYVESSTNNAYQPYAGSEFAVIYGRSGSSSTMSQSISTFVPGQSYILTYYMRIMGIVLYPTSTCVLTISLGGVTIDTFTITYSNVATYRLSYTQRTATVVATSQMETLQFTYGCSTLNTYPVDLLLDNITMVGAGKTCGMAP